VITAPDQNKPGRNRSTRIGAVLSALALLTYLVGNNHRGHIENIWLVATAAVLIGLLLIDWALRRNGLKR
jgi:hypothetical protein